MIKENLANIKDRVLKMLSNSGVFDDIMLDSFDYIRVQEVILTDLFTRGTGRDGTDPVRKVVQVFSKDGYLLAEKDPYRSFGKDHLIDFAAKCLKQPDLPVEQTLVMWMLDHHPS